MSNSAIPTINCLLRTAFMGLVLFTFGCSDSSDNNKQDDVIPGEFTVTVLSSAAEYVSGGDARVAVEVPESLPLDEVRVTVEERDVSEAFSAMPGTHTLQGRVDGLAEGDNLLRVESAAANPPAATNAITQFGNFAISGFANTMMSLFTNSSFSPSVGAFNTCA